MLFFQQIKNFGRFFASYFYTKVHIFTLFYEYSMTASPQALLKKYGDIIKEEVNVKQLEELDHSLKIQKIFKPIGSQLSAKFGKDTGKIIQLGKQGNIKDAGDEKMIIFDPDASGQGNEWTLEPGEYEIAYEGLEGDTMAVDQNIIVKLDLQLTPELQRE